MSNLCTIDEIAQEWNVPKASLRSAAEKHARVTQDQKQLVRLALSKLKVRHERKLIAMQREYESEKERLEAMLCQNSPKK